MRYALTALNPFALTGADYSSFNSDDALNLYDAANQPNGMTDKYLADRANFLARKLWFSTQDINPVNAYYQTGSTNNIFQNDDTYFEDIASGYQIAQGFAPQTPHPNIHRCEFGDANANTLTGVGVEDHLYGGAGNDTLVGNHGNDYLEGGRGNDLYKFSTGDGSTTLGSNSIGVSVTAVQEDQKSIQATVTNMLLSGLALWDMRSTRKRIPVSNDMTWRIAA